MTKGSAVMARSSDLEMGEPQISPLRCASVEMTKGRAAFARSSGLEMGKRRISPLRCASVEMTKGSAVLPGRVVAEQEPMRRE
jgi:hypothetical protein